MEQLAQKWCLVKFLEDVSEGVEFSKQAWPLHITLADVFAVDWEATGLLDQLTLMLGSQKPLRTIAMEDTHFGPSETPVQVTLLQMSSEFQLLHNGLIDLLASAGAVFNTPQYTKSGFVAHSTVQKHARLHKGDVIDIDNLSIIDMYPLEDGNLRKLVKTIQLGT